MNLSLDGLANGFGSQLPHSVFEWSPALLPNLVDYLHTLKAPGERYVLDGFNEAPAWLAVAVVDGLKGHKVAISDPAVGIVEIPLVSPHHLGSFDLVWEVKQCPEFALLSVTIPPELPFFPYRLVELYPPVVQGDRGVILQFSGTVPNWLVATLAKAYRTMMWVAILNNAERSAPPRYIIAATDDRNRLGEVLFDPDIRRAIESWAL